MKDEEVPTPTISVHDLNFREVIKAIDGTLGDLMELGYRGLLSTASVEELDKLLYDLGLAVGTLEAARARIATNPFDTAERHDQ